VVELMPLPLVIAANTFVGKPWASGAGTALAAFTIALVGFSGLADLAGVQLLSAALPAATRFAVDAGVIVTAVAAAGFLLKPIRRDMAMFLPIDPENPVHTLALVLSTLLLGTQVTLIAFTDVLGTNLAQSPLNVIDLLEGEAPFLIVAVAGVGLLIRRNGGQAAERLGLVVPAWWHLCLALAAAGVFLGLGLASDTLSHSLRPDIARRVDATTQHVFGDLGSPLGIAALALLPGICEEILFRGALQPRIGLVLTALLFTSIHTQYGLSIDTLAVFVIALGLGLVRKYANTTSSCACHVTYNLLVGVGISGVGLTAGLVVEAALIGVSAYAIWTTRRRTAGQGSP
jgi:CAAX protease family protein